MNPHHLALPRRTSQDTDGDVSRVLGKLERSGQNYTVLKVLANSAALFRPFVLLSDGLNNRSKVPADVREAIILAAAARSAMSYEWAEHESMARAAGLSDEQLAQLATPSPDPAVFTAQQLLGLRVLDELSGGAGLSAGTWRDITAEWGPDGALDLAAVVGWWNGFVPTMLRAIGLERPDDR